MTLYFIVTNLSGGGAEKAILKIAQILKRRGHEIRLILLEDRRSYSAPVDMTIDYLYDQNGLSKGWLGRRLAACRLRGLLSRLPRADLVVSSLPFADEVTSLAGVSNHVARIANTLGMEVMNLAATNPRKSRKRKTKYQELYRNVSLVAVSEGVATDLRETFEYPGRIHVIMNPYDVQSIRAQSLEPPDLPADFPVDFIVHAGRFTGQKRHDVLLDAWYLWPEAPALILLTDSNPTLEMMISERQLQRKVWIAGFQPNPYSFFRRARCVVLCSDHEGLPNVLLEALACGTPVVSTDCPSGPSEILRNYPDCLVPCNNPSALAEAINQCLLNPPAVDYYDFSKYAPEFIARQWESLAISSG